MDGSDAGFFRKHLRGDYSLGRSYWLHYIGAQKALEWIAIWIPVFADTSSARYLSASVLGFTLLSLVAWIWGASGAWASANLHVNRGGKATWAGLARVAIVFGGLGTCGTVLGDMPAIGEHIDVALGEQPGPGFTMTVSADGRAVFATGSMNDGFADALRHALEASPSVAMVALDSVGGWEHEGFAAARLISERRLSTYVEGECDSACTLVLLAGAERVVTESASIGFHSPRPVGGMDPLGGAKAPLRKAYREAGVPAAFVDRALATPFDDMWYPTVEDLVANHVVTRVSPGGETASIATFYRDVDDLWEYLAQAEPYASMAEHREEAFEDLVEAVAADVEANEIDSVVLGTAGRKLKETYMEVLATGSAQLLLDSHELAIEMGRALLAAGHPDLCGAILFHGEGAARFQGIIPAELRDREKELLMRAMADPGTESRPETSSQGYRKAIQRALAKLSKRHATIVTADGDVADATPSELCAAGLAYLGAIGGLPPQQREIALRGAYDHPE